MSVSQSAGEAPMHGVPVGRRSPLPAVIAVVLACCAVVAGAVWGPFILVVASNLRPVTSRPGAVPPPGELDAARQQMWTVSIISFVALAVLVAVALMAGRWAFPAAAAASSARRVKRAAVCLISGVALAFMPSLLTLVWEAFRLPLYLPLDVVGLFVSFALAGAVAGFILSGLALPSAAASVGLLDEPRPRGPASAWLALVLSIIVACLVALLFAFAAQFTVGFFLHLVG